MPNSLENQFIADTFKTLLHTGDVSLSGGAPDAKLYSGDGFESSLTISTVSNGIKVSGNSTIYGDVISSRNGSFFGTLSSGSHTVVGNSNISGTLNSGSHTVVGNSNISGTARIQGTATISGNLSSGSHTVVGNSRITNRIDTNVIYADTYLNLPIPDIDQKTELVDYFYPVGSIFLSFTNTNPSVRFTGTTWVQAALGRFIVGVGTGNDGIQNKIFSAGDNSGEYAHKLTIAEMPRHTHIIYNNRGEEADGGDDKDSSPVNGRNGESAPTGGDGYHNNTPPGYGLYVWRRTA